MSRTKGTGSLPFDCKTAKVITMEQRSRLVTVAERDVP